MAMLDLPGSHELPKDRALQNYGFETRNLYDSAKNPDTTKHFQVPFRLHNRASIRL